MPKCLTKFHGEIEYTADAVWNFPAGLFGFETETSFLPLEVPTLRPLVFLQSLSSAQLCFVTIPVLVVDQNYRLTVSPDDLVELNLPEGEVPAIGEDLLCLVILTIQQGKPTTADLMGPVLVNSRNRRGLQIISAETSYSHRHIFVGAEPEVVCS
jgi:flagellar assembly factor FliW